MNYDSPQNQRIKSALVQREVIHCASSLVAELYRLAGEDQLTDYTIDDFMEIMERPSEDGDDQPDEVYEHWIVSKWLAEKLAAMGETIGEFYDFAIWGRTCTGQAIALDYVIGQIAEDMEILEGQRNEWKNA